MKLACVKGYHWLRVVRSAYTLALYFCSSSKMAIITISDYKDQCTPSIHRFNSFPGSTPSCGFFLQDERVQIITHVRPGNKTATHRGRPRGAKRTHPKITNYAFTENGKYQTKLRCRYGITGARIGNNFETNEA